MKKKKINFNKLSLNKEMVAALQENQMDKVLGGAISFGQEWCPAGPTRNQTENSAAPGCACCVRYSELPVCNTLMGPGGQCN